MVRVTDLDDGVSQGTLPVRLEYNVEVDSGASGWVAQSFPVGWNVTPCVPDFHVIPRYDGGRNCEWHCSNDEEYKEPEMWHVYRR